MRATHLRFAEVRTAVYDAFADIDGVLANSPLIGWIGQQVFRQSAVQVHQGVAVELDTIDVFNQQFNRKLVVKNHLSFDGRLAIGNLALLDECTRVET